MAYVKYVKYIFNRFLTLTFFINSNLAIKFIDVTHQRIKRCNFKRANGLKRPLIQQLPHGSFELRTDVFTEYNLVGSLLTSKV